MTGTDRGFVCLMGMHRSGTSLAARLLEVAGADFGDPGQLMEPGPDNVAGYWENRAIKELDDNVLAALGGSWDQPPVLAPGWEQDDRLDALRMQARQVVDSAFGTQDAPSTVFAMKDPRFSLLLPFWRTAVRVEATIVVVRHPAEVAASLQVRNKMPRSQACLLWLRYLLSALRADEETLVVRYDDFFAQLPAVLRSMSTHVGLPPLTSAALERAGSHVSAELRHHQTEPDASDEEPLVRLASAVWDDARLSVDLIDPLTAEAIAQGWLRPPQDTEALDRARARVMELSEKVRAAGRARRARSAEATRAAE